MKKVTLLLLSCFLSLAIAACNNEATPTPSPQADVGLIREYACELVNCINEFDLLVDYFEATESRADAANICRDMELCYRKLRAEDHPSKLKPAREHVLSKMENYLDGAWDWVAIEEKDEEFKRGLKKDIKGDVKEIREGAEKLAAFIDRFYESVRNFEGKDAKTLCDAINSCRSDFEGISFQPQLKDAQDSVLYALEDLYEALYCKDAEKTPECEITPTPGAM
jgi:hypothetical protein